LLMFYSKMSMILFFFCLFVGALVLLVVRKTIAVVGCLFLSLSENLNFIRFVKSSQKVLFMHCAAIASLG
jgi:hypothetical protein